MTISQLKELSIEFYLILFIIFLSMTGTYTVICILHSYTIDMAKKDHIMVNTMIENNTKAIELEIQRLEFEIKTIQNKMSDIYIKNNHYNKSE